jgi:hypothetical protein
MGELKDFKTKNTTANFSFFSNVEEVPDNLQMKMTNLQCNKGAT